MAVLVQTDRFGTSIAQSLRGHADYLRAMARQRAEEQAAKAGRQAGVPDLLLRTAVAVRGDDRPGDHPAGSRPDSDDRKHVIAADKELQKGHFVMDSTTVRLICAVIAVLFGAVIVMRRKGHKAE